MPTKTVGTTQATKAPTATGMINQAKPDKHISKLQSKYPDMYNAMKGIGDAFQNLVSEIFPARPATPFQWRFQITSPGSTDALPYHYYVIMPIDPELVWSYDYVYLNSAVVTDKTPTGVVSIDIKVQNIGTTTWASLFQPGYNPQLTATQVFSKATKFAINKLYEADMLRVDILSSGSGVVGSEVILSGVYAMSVLQ